MDGSGIPEMIVELLWSGMFKITHRDVHMINTWHIQHFTGHNRVLRNCVLENIGKTHCCVCPALTLSVISGSLSQLIAERGRLPEDLSLHYHLQVLTALEYLAKKRVAHLDIKGTLTKEYSAHLFSFTTFQQLFQSSWCILLSQNTNGDAMKRADLITCISTKGND